MDLIDREAARKAICERCENYSTVLQECKLSGGWCKVFSLYDVPAVNRWIPCSERMPETDTPVICYMRSGQILFMELSDDDGWYCGVTRYYPRSVTHWMPLPEPPEKE